jgi:transcriptional regulator with XRE-family HTH domain
LVLLSARMALGDEKQSFGRRLREALKRAHGARGPAAIAREFNLRYEGTPVTVQAVHKWITGKALPSQDKLRALSLWLEVSPQWLRFGEPEAAPGRAARQDTAAYRVDPAWISRKYDALNEPHKRIIVELVVALLRLEGKR